jgi:HK97 family phage major capsid protein
MTDFLKFVKSLLSKGFASKEEKSKVATMLKELSDVEQEVAQGEAAKVDSLPETEGQPSAEDTQAEIEKGIKSLLKSATEEIKTEVKDWLSAQKELITSKSGIYHPEVREKRQKQNEYVRGFMSALYTGDVEKLKEISGLSVKELTTDASGSPYGGFVVDSELSAEIRHLTTEYGVARREMSTLQLTKGSYKANTLATDVTVYWVDEGAVVRSTEAVLSQDELKLEKLGAIVALTRELLEDGEVDLFSFVAGRVAEGFAYAEDSAFFKGDGTSTYGGFTGLLKDGSVNIVNMASTKTAFTDLTADDLLDMQDATPSGAMANGKYYMHRTILSIVRKLKDDNNQYIYQRPQDGTPGQIWDKPYVLVEVMPKKSQTAVSTTFVIFGDLRKACIFGYKGAISADRFNAGVVKNVANNADINLITTDREAIRWIERVGYINLLPTCVTVLKTAAS